MESRQEKREKEILSLYLELEECDDPEVRTRIIRDIDILEKSAREDQKVSDDKELRYVNAEVDQHKAEVEAESRKKRWWDYLWDGIKVVGPIIGGIATGLIIYASDNKEDKYLSNNARNAFDSRKYK